MSATGRDAVRDPPPHQQNYESRGDTKASARERPDSLGGGKQQNKNKTKLFSSFPFLISSSEPGILYTSIQSPQ